MWRGGFFKIFDDPRTLCMMTRTRGNLGETQRLHLPAHGSFVQRGTELLPYPLCKVLQTPALDAMDRRDRTALDDPCKRSALRVVELG